MAGGKGRLNASCVVWGQASYSASPEDVAAFYISRNVGETVKYSSESRHLLSTCAHPRKISSPPFPAPTHSATPAPPPAPTHSANLPILPIFTSSRSSLLSPFPPSLSRSLTPSKPRSLRLSVPQPHLSSARPLSTFDFAPSVCLCLSPTSPPRGLSPLSISLSSSLSQRSVPLAPFHFPSHFIHVAYFIFQTTFHSSCSNQLQPQLICPLFPSIWTRGPTFASDPPLRSLSLLSSPPHWARRTWPTNT
jgi:hypothetical protein